MNDSSIAVRYAKALFESAQEQGVTKTVLEDLRGINQLYRDVEAFRNLIDSPIIQLSDKLKLFDLALKKYCQPLTFKFILLITQNKREAYLPAIVRRFERYFRSDQGIISASFTTASEASQELIEQVRKILTNQFKAKVELSNAIDSEIIGGYKLRIEDRQLDASVATQLQKIKRALEASVLK